MRRAVYVRLKLDAFLAQFTKRVQTKDLKSTAVGQYRAIPGHEPMQTAEPVDRHMAGPEKEMIGVAENDRRAGRFEHLLRKSLDRPLCADWHEDRRFK
jgi:hypothetical protein